MEMMRIGTCPLKLLSTSTVKTVEDLPTLYRYSTCDLENCAWWAGNECVLHAIARALRNLRE